MYRQQKESVYHRKVDIFSVKSTKVTLAENQLFSGKTSKAFRGSSFHNRKYRPFSENENRPPCTIAVSVIWRERSGSHSHANMPESQWHARTNYKVKVANLIDSSSEQDL